MLAAQGRAEVALTRFLNPGHASRLWQCSRLGGLCAIACVRYKTDALGCFNTRMCSRHSLPFASMLTINAQQCVLSPFRLILRRPD